MAFCRFRKGNGTRSSGAVFPCAFWQLLNTFAPVPPHPPKQASHPTATNGPVLFGKKVISHRKSERFSVLGEGTYIQEVAVTVARQTAVQPRPHAPSSMMHSITPSSSSSAWFRRSSIFSARRRLVLTGQVASVPPLGNVFIASTGEVSPATLKQFAFPSLGYIAYRGSLVLFFAAL